MKGSSIYHRSLRVLVLVTAFVLVFDSGALSPATHELSANAQRYVANVVGMTAAVPENELNVITAGLEERSRELDRREREIDARAVDTSPGTSIASTYVLSAILLLLLALIVTNYVFDYVRSHPRKLANIVSNPT